MKYESMILCPDTDSGYQALHEAIQDGWEPIFHWATGGTMSVINHIALRRPMQVRVPFGGMASLERAMDMVW